MSPPAPDFWETLLDESRTINLNGAEITPELVDKVMEEARATLEQQAREAAYIYCVCGVPVLDKDGKKILWAEKEKTGVDAAYRPLCPRCQAILDRMRA